MAVRTENLNLSRETPLKKAERDRLLGDLSEHTIKLSGSLVLTPGWRRIQPYIEMIGTLGYLQGGQITNPAEQAHLRKMIALQTSFSPRMRGSDANEFMAELDNAVGPELETARAFPEDLAGIPRPWKNALTDVVRFQQAIDPESTEV